MGKTVILGGGESGIGAAVLAKSKGESVWLSDRGKIADRFKSVLLEYEIPFEEGKHTTKSFFDADIVIKSPGIPGHVPVIEAIRSHGIPIVSEIEYGFRHTNARIIAITGSNGKTTTTSLIWHLLTHLGIDAGLGGNIGDSFAMQVATRPKDCYVLEISSFQLDDIATFRPDIALLLNITPDHLDRYGYSMDRYADAKMRITENQTAQDALIYWTADPVLEAAMSRHQIQANRIGFDLQKGQRTAAWMQKKAFVLNHKVWAKAENMQLMGPHNYLNTLAALLATQVMVKEKVLVQEALDSFDTIPHRLEKVAVINGVRFINDSKATNVDSVRYALESMDQPTIWIGGGVDKGNDYDLIRDLVNEKVKAIVGLGVDVSPIEKAFPDKIFQQVQSMAEAIQLGKKWAGKGETVLLSPACASFDLFNNYEDRGNQFRQLLLESSQ
ncbi:MAG: UDP-N-acetylmuramoyl-L-alanine--D-glutamate ligase [Bacteroidota bacterium]